jgi:mono/diheme cytochrome c family protein
MPRRLPRCLGLAFLALSAPSFSGDAACAEPRTPQMAGDARPDPAQVEFFEKHVRPVLANNCFECHGPDKKRGGLRLDSREAALAGGDSGPALVPGDPGKTRLLAAVRHAGELKMPPSNKLSERDVAALEAWVKMGAPWPGAAAVRPVAKAGFRVTAEDRAWWAFRPVGDPSLPAVKDRDWGQSPLDRFVLARLEEKGLRPAAAADRRTLLRRAAFDLTGLPPAPEEVERFVNDRSPLAWENAIDRLLASPHYGERWARHWLDVARYGEDQAHTFQARKYPDGFRYRDWVVKAFNSDMPYDRFVVEQFAGDLIDGPGRADRLAATGLFALGPVYYGRAVADELDDRVDTLSRAFLGLTVACARCHDHKFDPISVHDYFALAGVFSSTDYKEYVLIADGGVDEGPGRDPTDKKAKQKNKDKAPRPPAVHALREGTRPANMRVHVRGNPNNLGDEAPRRFLAVLTRGEPAPFAQGSGRLELAKAIATRDNPLTARVLVNRVWAHLFGRGLVATTSNFGKLGEPPSHPELLDWLAARFVEDGWSVKKLIRRILLSSTYQMSSRYDDAAAGVDPDNRLLWRMNRRRLEVEPWRDAMLAVAGNLDRTFAGPSRDLAAPDNQRRTLYAAVSRHNLDPMLRLFDFPDPNLTSDRRAVTSVPLQQLFVLNSDFMVRQAKALAARLTTGLERDDAGRIRRAFLLVFGRPAAEREVELGTRFLAEAGGGGLSAWERYAQVLLSTNEFAFID